MLRREANFHFVILRDRISNYVNAMIQSRSVRDSHTGKDAALADLRTIHTDILTKSHPV